MSEPGRRQTGGWAWNVAALAVMAAAWAARLIYARQISLHVDEFTTILAAQMIGRHSLPIMPSGIFYDNGLLFSYAVAGWIGPLGFHEWVARFPALMLSMLSTAMIFRLGRRFLGSPTALLAAALLALAPEVVMWGVRARGYALLQFGVVAGVWACVEGLNGTWRGRWRAVFWLGMWTASLAHLVGVLDAWCALGAAACAWLIYRRAEKRTCHWMDVLHSLWIDGVLAAGLVAVMIGLTWLGQPVWVNTTPGSAGRSLFLRLLNVDWVGLIKMVGPFLFQPAYLLWSGALCLNLYMLARRLFTRQPQPADMTLLYLQLMWIGAVLTMTILSPWHMTRYALPLAPILFLVGSHEITDLAGRLMAALPARYRTVPGWASAMIIMALVGGLVLPHLQWALGFQEPGYDLAFHYVREQWHPGDTVMTFNTSAGQVYLNQCDYYPIQIGAWVVQTPAGMVDRFGGARWIEMVEQLQAAMAESERIWFVMDRGRFDVRVLPEVQNEIQAHFEMIFEQRDVMVMLYERAIEE